ncbi:unnamed protein product [Adineta ricciae]|uniref:Uncharacterized protein n=1 Tax=Adineta ricciae TaxID=249248 RepID=A0A815VJZ3_ADIRI|nr:unnamed protein product [Adineta ricciae]CAF1531473.1 unnamed protein product [Adineta ricciae]
MIRFLKKKAHGTRNLVTQIADLINTATAVERPSIELSIPTGMNSVGINSSIFDKYRLDFVNVLHTLTQNEMDVVLFLRYKDVFVTFHTVLYDAPYNCCSYIVSYNSKSTHTEYGQVIVFFKYREDYYAFI